MNYFQKNYLISLKVYYFYFIKKKSRKFFFILVWRKVFNILNRNSGEEYTKGFLFQSGVKKKKYQRKISIEK